MNVGTHSIQQSCQALHRLRLALYEEDTADYLWHSSETQSYGREQRTRFTGFRLVNMVFNDKIAANHGIDLAAMHRDNQDKTEYVPTSFPGLKYNLTDEKGSIRVKIRFFDTGEIIVMGVVDPWNVRGIFDMAKKLALQYPDYHLPASNKRFEYRRTRKRQALLAIDSARAGGETDTDLENDEYDPSARRIAS